MGTDVFSKFMASYGKYIPDGLKRILNLSEKGTELGLDVAAGTVKDVKKVIKKVLERHELRERIDSLLGEQV